MTTARKTTTIHKDASELNQAAQDNTVLGIGTCWHNPSGCYDILKGITSQLHHTPFVQIYINRDLQRQPGWFTFLNEPPQSATKYTTAFFTGCGLDDTSMLSILNILANQYKFTNIKYSYLIVPPQASTESRLDSYQWMSFASTQKFKDSPYTPRLLYAGMDTHFPYSIGMPRLELKNSDLEVPLKCYGLIRFSQVNVLHPRCATAQISIPKVTKYLNQYFQQVAKAGEECPIRPIQVIAIGVEPTHRELLLKLAKQHSIDIDFCDQYPKYRLPHQEDFLKVLCTIKAKQGIVAFDDVSTQCLFQTLSIGSSVMLYADNNFYHELYTDLVNLLPKEYQPTAQVILGLSDNYQLLQNKEICQNIYKLLHLKINEAHQRFDDFRKRGQFRIRHYNSEVSYDPTLFRLLPVSEKENEMANEKKIEVTHHIARSQRSPS